VCAFTFFLFWVFSVFCFCLFVVGCVGGVVVSYARMHLQEYS